MAAARSGRLVPAALPAAMAAALAAALLAGCEADAGPAASAGTGDAALAGMAVVCSDHASTAIAVLDGLGEAVTAPLLLHSGTVAPRVQAALGGDVDLPTVTAGLPELVLLDRYPNGVLTRVDPVGGAVLGQAGVSEGFAANPHDALALGDGRTLVTRYGRNPSPADPGGLDAGDDLLLLGPGGAPLAARALTDEEGFPARPDRLVPFAGSVWVSLNRLDDAFLEARPGALARIALPVGDAPEVLDRVPLDGLVNCGPLATDGARLAVACSGRFEGTGYGTEGSGVAVLDAAGTVVARLDAADPRVGGALGGGVALAPGGEVVAVVYGDTSGAPDRVIAWRPADDAVAPRFTASGPFVVFGLATATDGVPVVADADPVSPRVCRLLVDASGAPAPRCLDACAATGLPPRQVRRLLPAPGAPRHP